MHHGTMMMSAQDAQDVIDVPTNPSDVTATANGADQIDVTWTDNSDNEDNFIVEWSLQTSPFVEEGSKTVAADETSASITGLLASTRYWVRVRGVNAAGEGGASAQDDDTTGPAAPDAPDNNGAVADSTSQITQTWDDNSHNEDNFRAQIAENAAFNVGLQTDGAVAADAEEKVWTGLDPGTEYFTRVRAENSTGNSAYSNTASASTDPEDPDPPAAPSGLTATKVSDTEIDLAWTDNSDDETLFRRQKALDADFTVAVGTGSESEDETSFRWPGLDPNTEYFFRVRAENAGGNSDWSNVDSASTDPSFVPDIPTNHSADADSPSAITHSWDDVEQEDEYEVERADDSNFTTNVVADTVPAGTTSKQWTGLDEATEYWFRVRAVNSLGESDWNSTNARTQVKAPTSLSGQVFDEGELTEWVRLTWTDESSEESNYEVHKDDSLWDTIAAGSEQYDVSNPNHEGTWKVRAIHGSAPASDFSNTHVVS